MQLTQSTKRTIILFGIILVGCVIRISFVLQAKFPLNDGGFFFSMIRDLQANDGALPVYSTYNQSQIPYVYPPLAFYLVDFLVKQFSISELSLLIYLPVFFSCVTLLAYLPLAREFLKDDREFFLALFLYAIFIPGYFWIIMGGGLTRALGFPFALASITAGWRFYTSGKTAYAILCALMGALAVFSHPNIAWFAILSIGLFFFIAGRNRRAILQSILVVFLVLLFTSPWWMTVIRNHGISPLIEAFSTESFEWETWRPLLELAAFGSLGIVACIIIKDYQLPVWFFLIFLLDPRNAPTVAIVPLAMLMSIGYWRVIYPSWQRMRNDDDSTALERSLLIGSMEISLFDKLESPKMQRIFDRLVMLFAVMIGFRVVLDYWNLQKPTSPVQPVEARELEMMAWIQEEIPADRTFLILSADIWWNDKIAEWFPALTGRRSLLTAQGHEWISASYFFNIWKSHTQIQKHMQKDDLAYILAWQSEKGEKPDYLYYSTTRRNWFGVYTCCEEFEERIQGSPALELVHREGETMLFKIIR
jgi:hypothetical protein